MTTLPDGAKLESGQGGLERLALRSAAGEAHVYLHGAHVTHFQPQGERPVLWVSRSSAFEGGCPGKAIRGGVPVCFPWFGPKPDAPLHGVARVLPWSIASVEAVEVGLRAVLELSSNEYTRRHFEGSFRLALALTAGRSLSLELTVANTGSSPFRFEEALHTYFAVGDVRRVTVRGLEGAGYVDKTDGGTRKTLGPEPLAFTQETDRVFPGSTGPLTIVDPAWDRRIAVRRSGSRTAVAWNPWTAKAKAMPDFGDDEWPEMLCVESANALDDAVTLAPGARHALSTTIEVERAR